MKTSGTDRDPSEAPGASPTRRRSLLLGAGVAGAAAVAARVLPTAPAEAAAVTAAPKVLDDKGGYQLTAHVRRYYETTKV